MKQRKPGPGPQADMFDDWDALEMARLCERCHKPLPSGWDYACCETCGKSCPHGNSPADCSACTAESDRQFDASRENRLFGGR